MIKSTPNNLNIDSALVRTWVFIPYLPHNLTSFGQKAAWFPENTVMVIFQKNEGSEVFGKANFCLMKQETYCQI